MKKRRKRCETARYNKFKNAAGVVILGSVLAEGQNFSTVLPVFVD